MSDRPNRGRRRRASRAARPEARLSLEGATVQGDALVVGYVGGDVVVGAAPEARTDAAVGRLANEVRHRWTAESTILFRRAPERLRLAWASTGRPVQPTGAARDDLRGDVSELAERFRGLPVRHLVVLGAAGAGKTVLAVRLLLDLVDPDDPREPVPVLLPLSSWTPEPSLDDWMAGRLAEDHPWLAPETAAHLLRARKVMPVLDGLDELAPHLRATLVERVDRWTDDDRPLVLTCRGHEYEETVGTSGSPLSRAPVVEIGDVEAEDAAAYLRAAAIDGDVRWEPLLARLVDDPEGPVGKALSTPLMVELLRTAYLSPATDPAELLDAERFPSREAVEEHLIDRFVPAVYAPAQRPAYRADRARRWLGFLARRMRRHGTADLSWGEIWTLPSALLLTVPFALAGGLVFGSMFGAGRGLVAAAWFALVAAGSLVPGATAALAGGRDLTDPVALLRRLRGGSAGWALLVAVAAGLLIGTWFGAGLDASAAKTAGYALGLAAMFAVGALASTAWGTFVLSRTWFALIGRLPFGLVGFLRDAHERGALRQVGAVYQFRHALLRDRLGADAVLREPEPERAAGRGLPPRSVPAARVGLQVAGVLLATVLLTAPLSSASLRYRSGDRPAETVETSAPDVQGTYVTVRFQNWTLPPGATRTTEFAVEDGDERLPLGELSSILDLPGACTGAAVEFTAAAGGRTVTRVVLRRHLLRLDSDTVRSDDFPDDARSLTVSLKRLDDADCTVTLSWQEPHVAYDHLLNVREFLRS
ncbi:NACHT domain-containing protein [Actinomadura rifamycini]|uniref:NACHT domain-containing protein n=1 Tax=Actinomadura rifamycini TaxID=31962 RepID=UPI0004139D53|nr:NACHT domain-containing protein [Actinomadura rifamycini]